MKVSDIFGNIYHLQRRRRNAGLPYKRHKTLSHWYTKRYIEIIRSKELNYFPIVKEVLDNERRD